MSAKPAYWELLRHPNWQRKRLEVMQRDNFLCQQCGSADKTLNVHHTYYTKGAMPWEYPIESLRTFCEECHSGYHATNEKLKKSLGLLHEFNLQQVLGFVTGILIEDGHFKRHDLVTVSSYEFAAGIGLHYSLSAESVIGMLNTKGAISINRLDDLMTGILSVSAENKEPD